MIWVLLFGLIFSSVNGGNMMLLPGSKKIVRKSAIVDERKEELLGLIELSQNERKYLWKETRTLSKKLNELLISRYSERNEFDALIINYIDIRKNSQKANLKLALESQKLILEEEWQDLVTEFKKEFVKLEKALEKDERALESHFLMLERSVTRHLKDQNSAAILERIHDVKALARGTLDEYSQEILNEKSLFYRYDVEEAKIIELQTDHEGNIKELLYRYVDLYFISVNNTNDKEWKRIRNKLKLSL